MLIAQITDCHVVEPGELLAERIDTAASLRAALAHIESFRPRPDVIIATGDLVNDGRPEQYAHLAEIVSTCSVPMYVVPGNHDHREHLRSVFPYLPSGGADDPLDHVIDQHPLRLVGLDTTVPGSHAGELTDEQLTWLDQALGDAPDRPTLVFQHHPPFETGIAWMDEVGLADPHREAEVVSRHDNVVAVTAGHVHRPVTTAFGGTVASCWPSTGAQVALALDGDPFGYVDEPPAVVFHLWNERRWTERRWRAGHGLTSHLSRVGSAAIWRPAWAVAELDARQQ
jgi:3',5'-cyclic-AMP phosphodiesterase